MNREDKICLVLQGLINGVDYETGEAYGFSDTVIDSLKAVTASLECDKRNQYTIDSVESAEAFEKHFFEETLKTLPRISSDELREVGDIFFKARSGEFDQAENNDRDTIHETFQEKIGPSKAESHNLKGTIPDLARQMFDIEITNTKGRLASPGWFYTGSTQVKCNVCGNNFEIFRRAYTTKAQLTYHYYALVCKSCLTIKTPSELEKEDKQELHNEHRIDVVYEEHQLEQAEELTKKPEKPQETNLESVQTVNNPCAECECEIPRERLDQMPDAIRCAPCQSTFEKANPGSVARKVEEKLGTRDDFKNMRNKQYGTNIHNKI